MHREVFVNCLNMHVASKMRGCRNQRKCNCNQFELDISVMSNGQCKQIFNSIYALSARVNLLQLMFFTQFECIHKYNCIHSFIQLSEQSIANDVLTF